MQTLIEKLSKGDREPSVQERMEGRRVIGLGVKARLDQFFEGTAPEGSDPQSIEKAIPSGVIKVGLSPIMVDAMSLEFTGTKGEYAIASVDTEGNLVFIEREGPQGFSARSRRNDPDEIRDFVHQMIDAAATVQPVGQMVEAATGTVS